MPKSSDRTKKRTEKNTNLISESSTKSYGTVSPDTTISTTVSSSVEGDKKVTTSQMDITEYNSTPVSPTTENDQIELSTAPASTSIAASYTSTSKLLTTVDEEIEIIGFGRFQFLAVMILGIANASDAIELLCASFILPQLPDFTDFDKSFLSSAIFIGMLIGGLFFGIASDFLGRKTMLITALLINAIFGALSALAPTQPYTLLILCRIIAGFGVGGSIPGVFTLTVEILPIRNRGFWLSVVAWFWMIGSIYGAGMAWLMIGTLQLSWRYFALVCAIPAFVGAILIALFLYESPRYLYLNGAIHQAESILNNIAQWNKTDTRLMKGYRLKESKDTNNTQELSNNTKSIPYSDKSTTQSNNKMKTISSPSSTTFVIADDDDEDDTNDISIRNTTSTKSLSSTPRNITSETDNNTEDIPASTTIDEEQGLLSTSSSTSNTLYTSSNNQSLSNSSSSIYTRKQQVFYIKRCCFCSRNGKLGRQILYKEIMRPLKEFFNKKLFRTSLLLMIIWFTLSLGWYGLTLWIPTIFHESNVQLDEYQDAFLVQAANLPGNILSALLMDWLGRKGVLIWSLIFAGIAAIGFPFTNSEVTTVLCACLLNAASTCTWNALDCLSTESFPTSLRTTAMGVLAASGRIGSIIGQFIFGALIHVSLFALLGVAGGVLVCGSIAGFLLPKEPKGRKLDETTD